MGFESPLLHLISYFVIFPAASRITSSTVARYHLPNFASTRSPFLNSWGGAVRARFGGGGAGAGAGSSTSTNSKSSSSEASRRLPLAAVARADLRSPARAGAGGAVKASSSSSSYLGLRRFAAGFAGALRFGAAHGGLAPFASLFCHVVCALALPH